MHEMDWTRAERSLQHAIELNPRNMPAHQAYASYLVARRRFGEAIDEARRCVDLEPASVRRATRLRGCFTSIASTMLAIRELRTVLQMDPAYAQAHFRLGQVLLVSAPVG